ncbi:MAG: ThuA domain-containing protein [Pirellulaceae bacterium]|jgi:type 1 glutamine amidotransferase|nr:ThuA domain-containing protein [Pirellulaceae bacterium]
MPRSTALAAMVLLLAVSALPATRGADADSICVLIVTGNDYPGHVWRETTPAVRQILEQDPRMIVRVIEDPEFLASPALDQYDVVVLHYMNWESPDPSPAASQRLQQFVHNGKGLVLLHFACGAWPNWPEFANLAGRIWDKVNSHDPRGPFRVDVVDQNHPVTRGLASFETDDELYIGLTGQRPITVLATAHSKVTNQDHPMAFVFDYGGGRVFHTPLGHDVKAFTLPGPAELIRRGCVWAAGREVQTAAGK